MIRLFSFEWCLITKVDDIKSKADTWRTMSGAARAASQWEREMRREGCFVRVRTVELVPHGTARISKPVEGPAGEWR